jgi:hypothetical protein
MAKIPAPKKGSGDCISVGGLTVCPHVVYLTKTQKNATQKMHLQNVSKVQKLAAKAQSPKKKKAKAKSA